MDGLNVVTPFNTSDADSKAYYNKLRPSLNQVTASATFEVVAQELRATTDALRVN